MEGKVVIMSVVLVSFLVVLGQIQVEAQQLRSCCPSTSARNIYNTCRFAGGSQSLCASTSGCRRLNTCPAGWQHDILEITSGKFAYTVEDNAIYASCCPNATARRSFDVCRATAPACASAFGCVLVPGKMACPPHFPYNMLKNTVNEYCKSGCVSSVCGAITTLQHSDASEVVNGAVEKCGNACSDFCTNKAASVITTLVETTAAA